MAERLGSSCRTDCWAHESREVARGAGSDEGGVVGRGWLAVCQFWGLMGRLGQVLVQPRNCLAFEMPRKHDTGAIVKGDVPKSSHRVLV